MLTDALTFIKIWQFKPHVYNFALNQKYAYIIILFEYLYKINFLKNIVLKLLSVIILIRFTIRINSTLYMFKKSILLNDTKNNFLNLKSTISQLKLIDNFNGKNGKTLTLGFYEIKSLIQFYSLAIDLSDKKNLYRFKQTFEVVLAYKLYCQKFKKNINTLYVSCDHTSFNVGAIFAAKQNNIKTIYVQHGAIHDEFPPLITDLSILKDEKSKKKYLQINKKFNVSSIKVNNNIIVFEPVQKQLNYSIHKYDVALVLNLSTNPRIIDAFYLKHLKSYNKKNIVVCPHPLFSKFSILVLILKGYSIESLKNTEAEFFICGNTSAITYLTTLNKITLYSSELDIVGEDYYGFVRDKLVKRFIGMNHVTEKISH